MADGLSLPIDTLKKSARLGDQGALKLLRELAKSRDPEISQAAQAALTELEQDQDG